MRVLFAAAGLLTLSAAVVCATASAQDAPLISGGVAFLHTTNSGNTSYLMLAEPLLAAPIGSHILVESRGAVAETFSPRPSGQIGYHSSIFAGLTYLQAGVTATSHLTVVAGSFLVPFATYNERLSPVWIGNFQDGPITAPLGLMSSGTALGGMVRGNAVSNSRYSLDYTGYFSARSGNEQFNAQRSAGGRVNLYFPAQRLEGGLSYNRLLQGTQENFYSAHLWWEPKDAGLRIRSEYARGHHAHGYWVEADYHTQAFGGLDSWVGRFEPVFRMQQTFRRDTVVSDGVPMEDTQRADFGLNYNLPYNTRILTSYSRQFSASNNHNIWETGIVYRFLFPAWKGKSR